MRTLFITHRLPDPPDKGERIRAFRELKYCATRHEVDLFYLKMVANCKVSPALQESPYIVCDRLSWASKLRNLSQLINEVVAEAVPRCEAETLATNGFAER